MIVGPYINAAAIITGALIGAMIGGKLPERLRINPSEITTTQKAR